MLRNSKRHLLDGPAGAIEIAVDAPIAPYDSAPCGLVLIGHPHPLYGGTLDNKVAATLARAFVEMGWLAVRPNFRGVGHSAGTHDNGRGETEDILHLIDNRHQWLAAVGHGAAVEVSLALAGFSFGSFVVAQTACKVVERGDVVTTLVLAGAAAGKWPMPVLPSPLRTRTLLVHGEHDDTIPLLAVLDWTRPQELPVLVFPGGDHFFHRRLTMLRDVVMRHIDTAADRGRSHQPDELVDAQR